MQNFGFSQVIFQKLEHQRISYEELHMETNVFIESNLLRTRNFGLVYKGILRDGTLVVVKVFSCKITKLRRISKHNVVSSKKFDI